MPKEKSQSARAAVRKNGLLPSNLNMRKSECKKDAKHNKKGCENVFPVFVRTCSILRARRNCYNTGVAVLMLAVTTYLLKVEQYLQFQYKRSKFCKVKFMRLLRQLRQPLGNHVQQKPGVLYMQMQPIVLFE